MRHLRLLTFASLAALSACAPPDAALKVTVTVRAQGTSRVRADCVKLTVSNETQELKSIIIKRPTDDDAVFGVRRGADLPATVRLQASGYVGDCADEASLKLNAQGDLVIAPFPEKGVTEVEVFLDPPGSALDADRDGFVAASKGGLDCKDDDNKIFPGAGQVCANTSDTDCDGTGGCDDDECSSAVVCAEPPDRVGINTTITTMRRYECVGPFQVELRNANGPRSAVRDTAVTLASSLPGVTVHAVGNCSDNPLSSLTIPYGGTSFEVYLEADGQAFGNTTLTATAARVATPGSTVVEVHPQPIDHLEFTSPPRTLTAGQCSTEAVTLEFRDAQNRRTDVDAPTTVTFSSTPGDVGNANIFFSDAACGTDGSVVMLQAGQGSITSYLKVSRAGSFTVTATPSVQAPATQALTVVPAVPSQLAFLPVGTFGLVTTQTCSSGTLTLQLQDAFSNPVPAAADLPIRLSVSGAQNVTFFDAASACGGASATDYTIPAGASSIAFKARATTATPVFAPGTIRASVLNGAAIGDGTVFVSVAAGFASQFVITGNAQSAVANVCSANPFTIELRDSAGNPTSSMNPVSFTLSTVPAGDPSFRFYSGSGCQVDLANTLTIPPGATSGQFYFRGTRAVASFEIRAAATLTAPSNWPTGNSIRAGPPGKLVYVAPLSQTAQAGVCTSNPYVANVLDLFDNPTSFGTAQTVTVNSNPTGVTVGAPGACDTTNTVPLAAGATSVTFNARHTVTTPTTPYSLTATVAGFSAAPPVTLTVIPGPSTLQVDTPTGGSMNVTAGGCQQVTLTRRDSFGNNAPTSGATPVTLSFPTSTVWNVHASNNCSGPTVTSVAMNSTHTVTFSVSPRTSGTHQMTAAIGSGPTLQTAVVTFQVAPAAATLLFETPNTGTNMAAATQTAGGCTQVTVARKDVYGNDVPLGGTGGTVTFMLPGGTTVHNAAGCGTGTGVANLSLSATDARATFWVRATQSAMAPGGPALQSVVVSLASQSATLSLTVNPGNSILGMTAPASGTATALANGCVTVSIERRDALGNLVPVSTAQAVTVTPATNIQLFAAADCTGGSAVSMPQGASQRTFSLKSTVAASYALSVNLATQSVPLQLTVSPAALNTFVYAGVPASAIAGTCVGPITVRRRDAYGNDITNGLVTVAMSGNNFTFSTANDCAGATATLDVNIADGSAVSGAFYARSTVSGSQTMTATLGISTNASLTITPGTSILGVAVPAGGATSVTANTCVPVTVERRDSFNNPVPLQANAPLTFSPTTNVTMFNSADCSTSAVTSITVNSGQSSKVFSLRSTVAATYALTLSLDGQTVPLTMTVNPGPTTKLAIEGLPTNLTAGLCSGQLTVRRLDAYDNSVLTEPALTVTLSSARFQFSTTNTCGSPTTGATVTIANGSATSADALYATGTQAGAVTVTANATAPSGAVTGTGNSSIVAAAAAKLFILGTGGTVTAGACSGGITVEARDTFDNPVTPAAGSPITVNLTSSPNTPTFSAGGSCSGTTTSVQLTNAARQATFSFRPTTAPASEVLSAAATGLTSSTQTWTVNVGAPAKLAWKTDPVTTAARFDCVSAGVLQTLDSSNNPSPVAAATTVTPTAIVTAAATFYSDAACTTPVTTTSIPMGASEAPQLYMVLSGSGTATLAATSIGLTSAPNKSTTITATAATLEVATSSADVEAGGCVTLTVTRKVGGTASTVGNSTVDVSSGNAAITLYPSTDCTGTGAAALQRTIAHGASTTVVSGRGRSTAQAALPLDVTITASDPNGGYTNGTVGLKAYPLVRRGSCNIANNASSNSCALTPPLPADDISRSFLVFTSTGSPATTGPAAIAADEQAVECHLEAATGGSVVCSRASTGNGAANGMTVSYQVVSWGRDFAGGGVSVQHFPNVATSATSTNQAITAVDRTKSFLLASVKFSGQNDGDAFPVVRFTTDTNVEIVTNTNAPHNVSVQVVSIAGSTVTHASSTSLTGQTLTMTSGTSLPTASTFPLAMVQVTADSSDADLMCKRRFRATMPNATDVNLRRGADVNPASTCTGDNPALVNLQRVSLANATVATPGSVTLSTNATSATSNTFTARTTHRSIVFFGVQGPGGQTAGEGAFAGTGQADDDTGPFHATAEFNGAGTAVVVTRTAPSANATSVFTPFVVQFDP